MERFPRDIINTRYSTELHPTYFQGEETFTSSPRLYATMDHVYNGKAVATVQNLLRNYYLDTRNLGEQTNTQLLSSSYSSFLSRADHNSFTQCSAIVVPPRLAISAWFCHRENEKKISMTPWLRASSFWPMLHDTHAYSPPHKSASAARSVNIDASSSIVRSFIRPAFFH